MQNNEQLERSIEQSNQRVKAFITALDPSIDKRDDSIAVELAFENSSPRSKLRKIYALLSDATENIQPFVACTKGCSACCKMNVSITSVEAESLATASGKKVAPVHRVPKHAEDKFSGVPCPFLIEDACSVYEVRPFACRAHHSFDLTSYWCQPERAYVKGMGMMRLGGAVQAYQAIATDTRLGGFADVRDFFPG